VEYTNTKNENVRISITNDLGQTVYSEEFSGTGEQKVRLDLSGYAKGSYLVSLEQDGGKVIRKLIVQ
jgi:hypothetical protein